MTFTPGLWLFILSAMILASLIAATWPRRRIPAGGAFLLVMLCALIWTVTFTLEVAAQTLELKVLFCKFQFIGITFLPVAWLYLVMSYLGKLRPVRDWALLSLLPLLTTLLLWFVPRPNSFWSEPQLVYGAATFPVMDYDYGTWFYFVHVPFSYIIMLAVLIVLIRAAGKAHPIYRRQMMIICTAILLPVLTDILYVLGYSPIPHYNYTTAVFSVSCLMIAWALFRYKFLDLLPMARDAIIESMDDGVLVLDAKNRILDINPAAQTITGITKTHIGLPIAEISRSLPGCSITDMVNRGITNQEIKLGGDRDLRVYDLRLSEIKDQHSQFLGRIITMRDITERHQLFNRIQQLAIRDDLTGIFNRRHLMDAGRREMAKMRRQRKNSLSVMLMDLDDFKKINDTLGHAAGDQALIALTERCAACLRVYDIFGRLGGDEFAVILPGTSLENALSVAGRILNNIKEIRMPDDNEKISITVSMGIASTQNLGTNGLGFERLLALADDLMFQAKRKGKNEVVARTV